MLTIHYVRQYDYLADQWKNRMPRICECGREYGGIQIERLPVQDDPDDYDW